MIRRNLIIYVAFDCQHTYVRTSISLFAVVVRYTSRTLAVLWGPCQRTPRFTVPACLILPLNASPPTSGCHGSSSKVKNSKTHGPLTAALISL